MTQNQKLLKWLSRNTITSLEAINLFGVTRLSGRIYELRQAGHTIHGRFKSVRNRLGQTCVVKEYRLAK